MCKAGPFFTSLLLLISILNSFGQQKIPKIDSYYFHINKAELSIVDSDYTNALKNYQTAFLFKHPNSKDLFNAFLTSYFIKDTVNAKKYLFDLAEKGLRKKYITINWKSVSAPFFDYLSKGYDSVLELSHKGTMAEYGKILDSLFDVDQKVLSLDTNKDWVRQVQLNNIVCMKNIIKEKGFPSFQRVGFLDGAGDSPSKAELGTYWFLLWHVRWSNKTMLDSITLEAVMNGDFMPDQYALIMDQRENRYWSILPRTKVDPIEKFEIDKNRSEIYLDSVDEYERKVRFSLSHKSFILVNFFSIMMNHDLVK